MKTPRAEEVEAIISALQAANAKLWTRVARKAAALRKHQAERREDEEDGE